LRADGTRLDERMLVGPRRADLCSPAQPGGAARSGASLIRAIR